MQYRPLTKACVLALGLAGGACTSSDSISHSAVLPCGGMVAAGAEIQLEIDVPAAPECGWGFGGWDFTSTDPDVLEVLSVAFTELTSCHHQYRIRVRGLSGGETDVLALDEDGAELGLSVPLRVEPIASLSIAPATSYSHLSALRLDGGRITMKSDEQLVVAEVLRSAAGAELCGANHSGGRSSTRCAADWSSLASWHLADERVAALYPFTLGCEVGDGPVSVLARSAGRTELRLILGDLERRFELTVEE